MADKPLPQRVHSGRLPRWAVTLLAVIGAAAAWRLVEAQGLLGVSDHSEFSIKDPLDPSTIGYRHPFYQGYITPYDPIFPASDPAFAGHSHEGYVIELERSDRDASFGLALVRVPDGIAEKGQEALLPTACRLLRAVLDEPHHAGYRRLRIELHADGPTVAFDLRTTDCPA